MNSRQQQIVQLLTERRELTVQELSAHFAVAPMTIRRDLELLEHAQALTRTHGGAMISRRLTVEFAFQERTLDRLAEKQAIACAAASLVEPGMTLLLDTGTTTLEVAKAIAHVPRLRVLTSSLAIASTLYAQENIELILLGGHVRQSVPDLYGPLTEDNLRQFHTQMVIIGADAARPTGAYASDLHVANVSRAAIANTDATILVVDSTKFTRYSFALFAEWSQITHLITDDRLDPQNAEWLRQSGVRVRCV